MFRSKRPTSSSVNKGVVSYSKSNFLHRTRFDRNHIQIVAQCNSSKTAYLKAILLIKIIFNIELKRFINPGEVATTHYLYEVAWEIS